MDHSECTDALAIEVARFASAMSSMSRDTAITTCPGWNAVDLAEHLGLIHRWAEELVRLRSPERIARAKAVLDRDSVGPEWIQEGGDRLVATLRDADPDDPMWAWGLDQHVRFWSRRQLHETLVHRMDLELSEGGNPSVDPVIAIDAIDEFLANLSPVDPALRGHGEKLVFRVDDSAALWSITRGEEGFAISNDAGRFDTEVVGTASELLLVILRRRGVEEATLEVTGDPEPLNSWLAHTAF